MNTLKSGTTIVVLLGVLYGVYVVLSKPDRLREFPLPGASTAAKNDPGPDIEFSAVGPAAHSHAEPHLAVESGGAHGLGVASSPASPALPSPMNGPPELARPAPPAGDVAAVGAANAPLGAGSSVGSNGAGSGYGASAYGSGGSASAGGSSYGASTPGYGGGSRYSITSASTGGVSDGATAGGATQPSNAYQPGVQTAGSDAATGGVQPAYELNAGSGYGSAGTVAGASAEVKSDALTEYSLRQMWAQAEQLVNENKFKEALAVLSRHYSNPGMPWEHREAMVPWLDALAAKVIYSKQHLLEQPYEARSKETLFDIQERFNVPWQLLQNINSDVVKDPQLVVVGTQLKVVKGPFRAEVELARGQLTVYLNELYAGRFPFTVGSDMPRPGPGPYKVVDKRLDRVYYGSGDGKTIPASDPSNPYGGVWLDLGQEMSIHGSPPQPTGGAPLGCISLSPQDAKDVYGILSLSSEVVIR